MVSSASQKNIIFTGGEPTWANACVGNNGNPGYIEYAKGFSKAANMLIDMVIKDETKSPVDELVYPVCFNMRHSIELYLKGAIQELEKIACIKEQSFVFDQKRSHDIGNIWKFFSEKAKTIDNRYNHIINSLNDLIAAIATVDATGQTFRYSQDKESQKHLVNISLINFFTLKEKFNDLENLLDDLYKLNKQLYQEYKVKSFTKNLSRKQIISLTSYLPPRDAWHEDSFTKTKSDIMRKFSISSNELSKAIKIIEKNYEMAPEIGIELSLLGVDEQDLDCFFSNWFSLNVERIPATTPAIVSSSTVFEQIYSHCNLKQPALSQVKSLFTPEKLAGLSALFYFARDLQYSEYYVECYHKELEEINALFKTSRVDVKSYFSHVFDKSNAAKNIILSLYFLRKNKYAEKVVSDYELEGVFRWLNKARERSIF